MSANIINAKTIKRNMIDNEYAELSVLCKGTKKSNIAAKGEGNAIIEGSERSLVLKNMSWTNTEGYVKLWNKVGKLLYKLKTNTATFDKTSYDQLVDQLRIAVTRRRFEYADLTTSINAVSDGFNDGKSVSLDEILPFGAVFLDENFRGSAVNKIDQKYGATGSMEHQGYSCGWSETLENNLYNLGLDTLKRVTDAVARAYVGKRNDLTAGVIVGTTYHATQLVAADTTGGSQEEKLYITLNSAIELLTNLFDPQTAQIITADTINLMCYPGDVRRINRAIGGNLNVGGKGKVANRAPLSEINNILPYKGDAVTVGKKTYTYTGVAKNYAYMFVPNIGITRQKRGLTQERSEGSALTLSQEEMAWYFIQQNYMDEFFGSSNAAVLAAAGTSRGFIVKITLPAA